MCACARALCGFVWVCVALCVLYALCALCVLCVCFVCVCGMGSHLSHQNYNVTVCGVSFHRSQIADGRPCHIQHSCNKKTPAQTYEPGKCSMQVCKTVGHTPSVNQPCTDERAQEIHYHIDHTQEIDCKSINTIESLQEPQGMFSYVKLNTRLAIQQHGSVQQSHKQNGTDLSGGSDRTESDPQQLIGSGKLCRSRHFYLKRGYSHNGSRFSTDQSEEQ